MLLKSGKVDKEEIADVTTKGYAHKEQPFIVNILKSLGFDSMYTEVEKGRKSIAIFDADNQVVYKEQTK